ncbi:MAG: hypothetical protein ACFFC7_07515 [Candidatus Hermodarchaeota archaeon]
MNNVFRMKLSEIQPSQLFISATKLARVLADYEPIAVETLPPVPIQRLGAYIIYTDGHTRALAAYLRGLKEINVYWDRDWDSEEELDSEAYEICLHWCLEADIQTIADLKGRIVDDEEYQVVWLQRCQHMQEKLEKQRKEARTRE